MNKTKAVTKIRVGAYGVNGHQIHRALLGHSQAELVGVAAFPE